MIVMIQSLVVEILPISIKTQRSTFDLFESMQGFVYKYNDIVVVSSKFVSMSEGSIVKLAASRQQRWQEICPLKIIWMLNSLNLYSGNLNT